MKLPRAMKIVVLLAALAALLSSTAASSQVPVYACSGANYTSLSSYHQTLEFLSATLPHKVSRAPRLFARDRVVTREATYALAQCRGDTDSARCRTCIYEGLQYVLVACGITKEVLLADELCTIQLSGTAISWSHKVNISVAQHDTATVQSEAFDLGIGALIDGVASLAANTSQRFATAVEEMDTDDRRYTAYGLAQCTPELSPADCSFCLKKLRSVQTLTQWSGGFFATTSCRYSFHLYKFFASEPMQQLTPVTSNTSSGDRKKKNKKRRIILGVVIGVSVAVIVTLLSLLALVLFRRRRRSSQMAKKTSSEEPKTESCDEEEALGASTVEHTACSTAREVCPSAIGYFDEIITRAYGKSILLFLDYDGTLARIVKCPSEAFMTAEMRQAVRDAARWFPTSIVTGRDVPKAMNFVQLEDVNYAGSHGLDIKMIGQQEHYQPLPDLEPTVTKATECLEKALQGINGASVENNKFCVSAHFRNVDEKDWKLVEDIVNNVLSGFPALRLASGKMVWELRSKEDFTKGDAVDYLLKHLLESMNMDSSRALAIHIGDDRTDEDAFKMLREKGYGFGVLVTAAPKPTEAFYSLEDTSEVMEFLRQLVAWREAEDGIVELHRGRLCKPSSRSYRNQHHKNHPHTIHEAGGFKGGKHRQDMKAMSPSLRGNLYATSCCTQADCNEPGTPLGNCVFTDFHAAVMKPASDQCPNMRG